MPTAGGGPGFPNQCSRLTGRQGYERPLMPGRERPKPCDPLGKALYPTCQGHSCCCFPSVGAKYLSLAEGIQGLL